MKIAETYMHETRTIPQASFCIRLIYNARATRISTLLSASCCLHRGSLAQLAIPIRPFLDMPLISLFIRSPATLSERRFDSDTALIAIKAKLETVTGIPAGEQVWDVYRDVEAAEHRQGGRRIGHEGTLQDAGVQEWECIQVSLHDRARCGEGWRRGGNVESQNSTQTGVTHSSSVRAEVGGWSEARRRDTRQAWLEHHSASSRGFSLRSNAYDLPFRSRVSIHKPILRESSRTSPGWTSTRFPTRNTRNAMVSMTATPTTFPDASLMFS